MNQPPRRWWNFSLRTLFVLVTVLCCYLAYQMSIIRSRQSLLQELRQSRGIQVTTVAELESANPAYVASLASRSQLASIPRFRRWLGDQPVQSIRYEYSIEALEPRLKARITRTFPEANVEREALAIPCHPGCFPPGTLVCTPSGPRPIDAITEGDVVYAISTAGQKISLPVVSIFRTENRLWEVETSQGVLLTTETQPLMARLDQPVAVGDLQPGDTILRWTEDEPSEVRVLAVRNTGRLAPVINLVLGNREPFVANGFLARSKPPADSTP